MINKQVSTNKPLVSIIVPAYNVDDYIEKCICSILVQSYKNIELIIVNDGSTDDSESTITRTIKDDERAKLINIKNSGVSVARNTGIKESSGDYVIFIDGDDYISSDYVDYMLGLIGETKAQFAFSKNCFVDKNEKQIESDLVKEVSSEEATTLLLSPNITVGCWNKIYSRSLLVDNNIFFAENLFYGEGLKFIIEVSQSTSKAIVGNKKVYYYRKNNISSATSEFDISKVRNGEKSLVLIGDGLAGQSSRVLSMFKYHLCLYRLGALVKLRLNGVHNLYNKEYQHWLSFVRSNCFGFLTSTDLNLYRKSLLIFGSISPYFLSKLEVLRQKRIVKNSVDS
ncbi:glycosyltransferase family 2 protein [Vibrio splendidus]|uniref:glycosyltransferase family 2 protein n=1 Tax=Vibrio splendidus TaxID=29497 RepID=UPI001C001B14|nr:glycosyltransferase family A protein [Vibrio splendidus]MBT9239616.1 glycosyltransferase [Vibrio splendidus]MDP2616112.1 glycosyltransferase family A protein [Vibrio splendidus]